jgi:hypothetical protein
LERWNPVIIVFKLDRKVELQGDLNHSLFCLTHTGAWFIHCHFEFHLAMGMAAVFIIEDGPTPNTSLPPPPPNFMEGRP